ncbi:MAG: hypothetical protein ACJ76U_03560 [Gaiellaceae bacterium]|jgi:hypothetical protein
MDESVTGSVNLFKLHSAADASGDSMPKVLIVEDDEVIADGMARHLRAAASEAVSLGNGRTPLARLR